MSESKPHLFNTIRLAKAEKKQFVEQLNENAPAIYAVANRRRLCVVYNVGDLLLTIIQSKKSTVNYAVVPRNLSTHGIGFVHGQ